MRLCRQNHSELTDYGTEAEASILQLNNPLASELYGMAHGFDTGAAIKATIEKILQLKRLPVILCTDSKSLYDCLVKLGTTQEKRLMVDLMCLRQSYERREIAEIKWIDGGSNPADAMTKSKPCQALKDLIDTNTIKLQVTEWVERTGDKENGISNLVDCSDLLGLG